MANAKKGAGIFGTLNKLRKHTLLGFNAKKGYDAVVKSDELLAADEQLQQETAEFISDKVTTGITEAGQRIRDKAVEFTGSLYEGLNTTKIDSWTAIKDRVVGDASGFKRLIRLGIAGVLWCATAIGSVLGAVAIKGDTQSPDIKPVAENIRGAVAGIVSPDAQRDNDKFNSAADVVTGYVAP